MVPSPTRRQFLAGLSGVTGLGAVGAVAYHTYTGPVALTILNFERSQFTVDVQVSGPDGVVVDKTYDVPASEPVEYDSEGSSEIASSRGGDAGIVRDRIIDHATRGTTYSVRASTADGTYTLDEAGDNTATVTCTGYVNMSEGRMMDELLLEFPASSSVGGIGLYPNYCGGLW